MATFVRTIDGAILNVDHIVKAFKLPPRPTRDPVSGKRFRNATPRHVYRVVIAGKATDEHVAVDVLDAAVFTHSAPALEVKS